MVHLCLIVACRVKLEIRRNAFSLITYRIVSYSSVILVYDIVGLYEIRVTNQLLLVVLTQNKQRQLKQHKIHIVKTGSYPEYDCFINIFLKHFNSLNIY